MGYCVERHQEHGFCADALESVRYSGRDCESPRFPFVYEIVFHGVVLFHSDQSLAGDDNCFCSDSMCVIAPNAAGFGEHDVHIALSLN